MDSTEPGSAAECSGGGSIHCDMLRACVTDAVGLCMADFVQARYCIEAHLGKSQTTDSVALGIKDKAPTW